jgi:hypothetical protein
MTGASFVHRAQRASTAQSHGVRRLARALGVDTAVVLASLGKQPPF